ncbi:unnamed protein product [Fusarium graminearum]|uniref:Uncharacterized protein n=1 Tax=Gibberella zeae TaxID=5518 RepID=A0A9N8R9F1_GIBZA|nr:unnamed protein product [Fusarium graminearum]CAG1977257.1 unnamed protein product [Fusarium graminearum]
MTPVELITHCNIEPTQDQYDRVKLVRFTYEYSSNQISHDNFLHAFFEVLKLPISNHITSFSHASTKKTPQPIPESHSAIMKTQRQDHAFSEMERQASLRGACLLRDRYRHTIASTTIS